MDASIPALRTLIVDDELLARDLLRSLVLRNQELELAGECASGREAQDWLAKHDADLILLDIQMPDLNGVQLAEQLSRTGQSPYIIFCTAYQQHAIKAFELNAMDYLVKPIAKERFVAAVNKAIHNARQQQVCDLAQRMLSMTQSMAPNQALMRDAPEKPLDTVPETTTAANQPITVRRGDELIPLLPADIIWVEAASQYVYLHTNHGRFMLSETLSSFSVNLPSEGFIRIHRSALVNIQYIRKVIQKPNKLYAVVLQGEFVIPVARSRKDLLPQLLQYAKQSMDSLHGQFS